MGVWSCIWVGHLGCFLREDSISLSLDISSWADPSRRIFGSLSFVIMVFLKSKWGYKAGEVSAFNMCSFTQSPFSARYPFILKSWPHSRDSLFYPCQRRRPPFSFHSWGERVTCCTESRKGSGICLFHLQLILLFLAPSLHSFSKLPGPTIPEPFEGPDV